MAALLIAPAWLAVPVSQGYAQSVYQGFGAHTPGGAGQPTVHITTLADAGPGSLREALAAGNRTIVFDVAGDIVLRSHLYVRGAFITVDGLTAPAPGITLRGYGPILHGTKGAHDVIIRGIRVRDAVIDGFQVAGNAYNIVLDHVSVAGSADGNIDITDGAHDVTVSWSIIGDNGKNMLIKYRPSRVTLHHNLLAGNSRNPQVRIDDSETGATTETTLDMRNNVVSSWVGYGTLVWYGPWANIVDNAYAKRDDAITVAAARVYAAGNETYAGVPVGTGTESEPFPAPVVDTQPALLAKIAVLAGAGVYPLDTTDRDIVTAAGGDDDSLPPPLPPLSPPPPPPPTSGKDLVIETLSLPSTTVVAGELTRVRYYAANRGTERISDRITDEYYLSTDASLDSGDVLLATSSRRQDLAPNRSKSYSQSLTIPQTTMPGSYFILVRIDALNAVVETDEDDNVAAVGVTVTSR